MINDHHRLEDINNYTLDQITFFYEQALVHRVNYINDVRTAVWADKKEIGEYIKKITE